MKKNFILLLGLFFCAKLYSQVVIKSHNKPTITSKGIFGNAEKISETILPGLSENEIIKIDKKDNNKFAEYTLI